jgi:hypothetical protein
MVGNGRGISNRQPNPGMGPSSKSYLVRSLACLVQSGRPSKGPDSSPEQLHRRHRGCLHHASGQPHLAHQTELLLVRSWQKAADPRDSNIEEELGEEKIPTRPHLPLARRTPRKLQCGRCQQRRQRECLGRRWTDDDTAAGVLHWRAVGPVSNKEKSSYFADLLGLPQAQTGSRAKPPPLKQGFAELHGCRLHRLVGGRLHDNYCSAPAPQFAPWQLLKLIISGLVLIGRWCCSNYQFGEIIPNITEHTHHI